MDEKNQNIIEKAKPGAMIRTDKIEDKKLMEKPLPLLEKLHLIMKEVEYLQKDAFNEHNKYKYASEKTIKESLHKQLIDKRILFKIETSNPRVIGATTYIDVKYIFIDLDSDATYSGKFLGSGQSRDEKGHYSAVTGAIKYILTSTFLIVTGNDPEDQRNEKEGKSKVREMNQQARKNEAPAPARVGNGSAKDQLFNSKLKWVNSLKAKGKIPEKEYEKCTLEELTKVMDDYKKGIGK